MKLYVLTHCGEGKNYNPSVFKTLKSAQKKMEEDYEACLYKDQDDESDIHDYVDDYSIDDSAATITYDDETYDVWEIFEVEVK